MIPREYDKLKEVESLKPTNDHGKVVVAKRGLEYAFEEDLRKESESHVRMCDYLRDLNEQFVVKQYKVPNKKLIMKARNSEYFTNLDNAKEFYPRALAKESRKFLIFIMPDGRSVQWAVLPWGI
ncbi:hypothetical protein Zmor_012087 [Zophobas morio]|uniref:Uncharacterized protein n=1 Tax=Zophobas morio TaxID=2755281 RepID=A0AA38LZW8_9CUCU|nr:hypothetical protein Zmor_012087 [Zophobas morio]